jgi:uncharacterized protein YjdB
MNRKSILLPLSLAALLVLAGCTHPATSSVASSSTGSVVASSSVDTTPKVTAVSITAAGAKTSIAVSETLQLTATVTGTNSPAQTVTWAVADSTVATISDAGLISAVKTGSTTFTATSTVDTTKSATFNLTVTAEVFDSIATLNTAKTSAKVHGVVNGLTSSGFILDEGTAALYVYTSSAPTVAQGDFVKAEGEVVIYKGVLEMKNAKVAKLIEGTKPTVATAVELTKTKVDEWAAASWADTALTLATTNVQPMSFLAEAKTVGTYVNLFIEGSSIAISAVSVTDAMKAAVVAGKWYDMVAYPNGYNSTKTYIPMVYVSATEHHFTPAGLTVTAAGGAKAVAMASTLQLSAAVDPVHASQEVTWASSDTASATIDAAGLITPVKASNAVTFTATSTEVATLKGTITLRIGDPISGIVVKDGTSEITSLSMAITDTKTLTAVVTPTTAMQDIAWASSDETVATVDKVGKVTAIKAGTANITATSFATDDAGKPMTATVALTVTSLPGATGLTVSQIKSATADSNHLYSMKGIIEYVFDGTLGGFYLTNPTTGETVAVYGGYFGVPTDFYTYSAGTLTFTKDSSKSISSQIGVAGKCVTAVGTIETYNGVGGLKNCSLTEDTTASYTYSASIKTVTNGTVTLSKSSELAYGETVTITCAPDTGYVLSSITVTTAYSTIKPTVSSSDPNMFTFTASCVNVVEVAFEKSVTQVGSYSFSGDSTGSSLDTAGLKAMFTANLSSAYTTEVISDVTEATNVKSGLSGQALGFLLGSPSTAGSFTISTSASIVKVVVQVTAYSATDTITVGTAAAQTPGVSYLSSRATKTLSFEFDAGLTSITFATNKCCFISGVDLYTA